MTAAAPTDLWRPFVAALPLTGGSISVMSTSGLISTVSTSDALAAELGALQLEAGEGPGRSAFLSAAPVLVPDVRGAQVRATWPIFGNAVLSTAARGMWAFPLMVGRRAVGVADLYSDAVGTAWSPELIAAASGLADRAAGPAVALATESAASERSSAPAPAVELRREVHQATGILIVQLDLPADAALARLQAHAFAAGRPVLDVARDVVQRTLDLRDDPR